MAPAVGHQAGAAELGMGACGENSLSRSSLPKEQFRFSALRILWVVEKQLG